MTPPLRVMHVITRLVKGGAQQVVLDLIAGLRSPDLETRLVAGTETGSEGSLWEEAEALGVTVTRLPSLVREVAPLRDYQAYWGLRRIIREFHPHVVHAHTSKAGLLGCVAARHEGVDCVLLAPHGHILREGAQIPGIPPRGIKRWILGQAARLSSGYADLVIAPNDIEREDGVRLGLWAHHSSVTVPNGVDTERFRPRPSAAARERLGLPTARPLVGVVARLTREKGVDLAVETLAGIPSADLVIAGGGPERDALEEQARALGMLERTRFLGLAIDIAELLPALDVCLVPSRTEAHGMVAAEALSSGVPVVAAAVGGLRSLLLDGVTGLTAPAEDVPGFTAAVTRLLGDRALARALAAAGRAHIETHFSRRAMLDRVRAIYLERVRNGVEVTR